jgi:hypothetical protein
MLKYNIFFHFIGPLSLLLSGQLFCSCSCSSSSHRPGGRAAQVILRSGKWTLLILVMVIGSHQRQLRQGVLEAGGRDMEEGEFKMAR